MKKLIAGLGIGAALAFAAPDTAQAQQRADGLVVVQIGDITIQDVNVAVAAQIVATACDLLDLNAVVAVIAGVDQNSRQATFCRTDAGKVKVTQN